MLQRRSSTLSPLRQNCLSAKLAASSVAAGPCSNTLPTEIPLRIENPTDKPEIAPRIPKGVLNCSGHNPNAQATQNYSIVEDLGQTPCVMSALEVLQSCPLQIRKSLLSAL